MKKLPTISDLARRELPPGVIEPVYVLNDEYTDVRSAGALNGTTATGGQANRTVVDTESKLSTDGTYLIFAGGKATPSTADPGIWYDLAVTRTPGIALFDEFLVTSASSTVYPLGFDTDKTGIPGAHAFRIGNANLQVQDNGATISPLGTIATNGTKYDLCIVLRSSGAFYFIKGGGYPIWTLIYISSVNTIATLYPQIANYSAVGKAKALGLAQLPTPFTNDYGIATQRLSGARSLNDTFAHESDCIIECTVVTLPSSDAIRLAFRQQDDDNKWHAAVYPDGSVQLFENVAGTPTSRGSGAAGSIANGQKLMLVVEGRIIKVYANNVSKISYTSTANFATQRLGKVVTLGGGSISDIVAYPRVLPKYLQDMLNRHSQ